MDFLFCREPETPENLCLRRMAILSARKYSIECHNLDRVRVIIGNPEPTQVHCT